MSRYLGPVCKLCRREGEKLFLKGRRCNTPKCSFERRGYPPGEHGQRPIRGKDAYRLQLRAKQKAKRIYGTLEKQFHNYYNKAEHQKGITGETLIILLERRLDNVVYRFGFASSRRQARQLVKHNHFLVNGELVNIPSYLVTVGDKIQVREKSLKAGVLQEAIEYAQQTGTPEWLELDADKRTGIIQGYPDATQVAANVQTQLIIELYSK
jgi:small subunit ribosomal protein S4